MQLSQGDIFDAIEASRADLAIVFGHVGFNEMHQRWAAFSARHPQLAGVQDPFTEFPNGPTQLSEGKWLWFVSDAQNHGMSDEDLVEALDAALSWASRQHIKSVATNGVANIDHGQNKAQKRQSDEQRARFLIAYAAAAEQKYGVDIELISLNDVFVRVR